MPALTVILAVEGDQAYIEECVRSVLQQATADVEVVAIDDAAGGYAPAILDALAQADDRLTVSHLPERAGTGEARNRALDDARGDYVWFIETTDLLERGAIPAVLHALEAERPDVLLLGHVRRSPTGAEKTRAPGLTPHLFDKILRRETIGDRFEPGRHGHLPVVWGTLAAAERIGRLDRTAYVHRPRANAHREAGTRADALALYERLLPRATGDVAAAMEQIVATLRETPKGPTPLLRGRRIVARRRRELAAARRRRALRRHYERSLEKPIDPDLAVFAAYWYRGYACNPRAIYEKARELVPGFRGVWVVEPASADAMPQGVEYVVAGTREYFDVIARAKYLVNNVNFPNHLVKRDGTVHVMTHHGTPLKRMGLDLMDTQVAGRRMDFDALLRRCARWDFSVSSNPLSTLTWERVYPLRYETLEVGYPRNDALANATPHDVERIRAELGIRPGQTAVLYAPTHREYRSGYVPTLDLATVADGLGDDHVILARLHYFYDADPHVAELHRQGRLLDVASHPSVEALCLAADVLVTDYSSIMFDYAVLDRPIVIHAPDWEVYTAMRGTYFDLLAEPPGAVTRTEQEVVAAIAGGDTAARERAAFRARYCPWDDGRASERVVRRVWLGEREAARPPVPVVAP